MIIPSIPWLRQKIGAAEPPSIATRHRHGLHRLSADQIGKAINETEKQINTIMLAFIGAAAFCILSLLTPDSALLGGNDKVNVPLAGPVSFVGFIIIGPAVLIVLRVYLEIYIQHGKRLTRVARLVPAKRDPTLLSSQNVFLRIVFAIVLSLLLPVTLLLFAWKAAVFPVWGAGLLCVAAAIIAGHAMLLLPRFSWRLRGLLTVSVALLAGGAIVGFGLPHRSFKLFRANLSGQWLVRDDLRGASLGSANLSGADLEFADLRGTDLSNANLLGAKLYSADLRGADLHDASLRGADLRVANLRGTNLARTKLTDADLSSASLSQADLRGADLGGAHLRVADLSGADMHDADLGGADLHDANLNGADLNGANLNGANLEYANLTDAHLTDAHPHRGQPSGADMSDARNLTQAQLDQTCHSPYLSPKLPPGLTLKRCPEPAAVPASPNP